MGTGRGNWPWSIGYFYWRFRSTTHYVLFHHIYLAPDKLWFYVMLWNCGTVNRQTVCVTSSALGKPKRTGVPQLLNWIIKPCFIFIYTLLCTSTPGTWHSTVLPRVWIVGTACFCFHYHVKSNQFSSGLLSHTVWTMLVLSKPHRLSINALNDGWIISVGYCALLNCGGGHLSLYTHVWCAIMSSQAVGVGCGKQLQADKSRMCATRLRLVVSSIIADLYVLSFHPGSKYYYQYIYHTAAPTQWDAATPLQCHRAAASMQSLS